MNGQKTYARPYAKAIFGLALQENSLVFWSQALKLLSDLASAPLLQSVCKNPEYSSKQITELFISTLKEAKLNTVQTENLIKLLYHYKRLLLLPLIAILFEEKRAQIEKTLKVTVESALPISAPLQTQLQQHLEKSFGREVLLHVVENNSLIGGIVISAGDWVADYSIKNHLEKLKQTLMNE